MIKCNRDTTVANMLLYTVATHYNELPIFNMKWIYFKPDIVVHGTLWKDIAVLLKMVIVNKLVFLSTFYTKL